MAKKKGDVVWYTVLDCTLDEVDSCERQETRAEALKFRRELRQADRDDLSLPQKRTANRCAYHAGPYRIAKLVLDG